MEEKQKPRVTAKGLPFFLAQCVSLGLSLRTTTQHLNVHDLSNITKRYLETSLS